MSQKSENFFVAFEGLDGSGKSTQATILFEILTRAGLNPLLTKEPTLGIFGQKIRTQSKICRISPSEELGLFIQDRREDVEKNIKPALLEGRPVIADRYILSNIIYQGAQGLDPLAIFKANSNFPWPQLTFILEIEVEIGLYRITKSRGETPDPVFENKDYLVKVKKILDDQKNLPGLIRLPGTDPIETTTKSILEHLKKAGFFSPLS